MSRRSSQARLERAEADAGRLGRRKAAAVLGAEFWPTSGRPERRIRPAGAGVRGLFASSGFCTAISISRVERARDRRATSKRPPPRRARSAACRSAARGPTNRSSAALPASPATSGSPVAARCFAARWGTPRPVSSHQMDGPPGAGRPAGPSRLRLDRRQSLPVPPDEQRAAPRRSSPGPPAVGSASSRAGGAAPLLARWHRRLRCCELQCTRSTSTIRKSSIRSLRSCGRPSAAAGKCCTTNCCLPGSRWQPEP